LNEKSVDELWHELYRDVTYLYLASRDAEGMETLSFCIADCVVGLEQVAVA
jgi:hypothetical protein